MYFIVYDKETKYAVLLPRVEKVLNGLFYVLISLLRYRVSKILTYLKISLNVKKIPLWTKDPSGV